MVPASQGQREWQPPVGRFLYHRKPRLGEGALRRLGWPFYWHPGNSLRPLHPPAVMTDSLRHQTLPLQDFAALQLDEINAGIQSRRNRIFLLMEEVRRLRIQQRLKV